MTTNLWTFETASFRIECDALDEEMSPRDSFCFEDDIAAVENGDVDWFCARVTVTHIPTGIELGSDYLGGCAYAAASDFVDGHRDPNPMNRNCSIMRAKRGNISICHYFPDMVSEAIKASRATLAALKQHHPDRLSA